MDTRKPRANTMRQKDLRSCNINDSPHLQKDGVRKPYKAPAIIRLESKEIHGGNSMNILEASSGLLTS